MGYQKTLSLWGAKGVLPHGIVQGAVGDCWWLAGMAALAEWPTRLQQVFSRWDWQKGIYEISLWRQGKPWKFVVDDYVASTPQTEESHARPIFTSMGPNGAVWPMILEKAGAKFWGTFERQDMGGFFGMAYYALTGRPNKEGVTIVDSASFYDLLKKHDNAHDVMNCAALKSNTYAAKVKVFDSHAYTLLGVHDYTDQNGKLWHLVKVRNPHGGGEYNGTFSDIDDKHMNQHAMEKLNHTPGDDGTFFMPFSEFAKGFSDVSFGHWGDKDQYVTLPAKWDRTKPINGVSFTLTNPIKQDVFVGYIHRDYKSQMSNACRSSWTL